MFNNKMNYGYDYYHELTEKTIRFKINNFLLNIGIIQYSLHIDISKIVYIKNSKMMNYCDDHYHPFEIKLNINLNQNNNIYSSEQLLKKLETMYMYNFIDIIIDNSIYRLHNTNIKKNIKKINKRHENKCSIDIIYDLKNFFNYVVEFHDYNVDIKNFSRKNMIDSKYSYVLKFSQIISYVNVNSNIQMIEKEFRSIHKNILPFNYRCNYERYALNYNDFQKYLYNDYTGILNNELDLLINNLRNYSKTNNIFINYKM